MLLCQFQIFRGEQGFGSDLDALYELNLAKIHEEAGSWVNFVEAEKFASETCVFEFTRSCFSPCDCAFYCVSSSKLF